jgi:hypothetical protein
MPTPPSPPGGSALELLPASMVQAALATHKNHTGVVLSTRKRKAQQAFAEAVRRKHAPPKTHLRPPPPPDTPDSEFAALPELWQPSESEVTETPTLNLTLALISALTPITAIPGLT